jgi:site-specific DNA recombinase
MNRIQEFWYCVASQDDLPLYRGHAINSDVCDNLIHFIDYFKSERLKSKSDKALSDIDKRLEELQTELLKLATSNADYDKVGDEIHRLRDRKQKLLLENANRDELKKRITDISTFLKKQPTALTEYDEQLNTTTYYAGSIA